mmetsp:Transcript_24818/g.77737  ORF Transcript_24818/g.77737 Transcript_24818/m.77737 type:complete len:220 (-) Transcript_24818:242-901(-)
MRRAEHVRLSAALRRGRPPGAVCRPRQRRGGVDHPRLPLRALGRLPAAGVPGREDLPDHQGGALGDPRCHRELGGRRGGHRPADWKGCGAVSGVARAAEARALLCARALAQQPLAEDAAVGAAAALARRLHRHPGRHGGVGRRGAPVHRRHRRHLLLGPLCACAVGRRSLASAAQDEPRRAGGRAERGGEGQLGAQLGCEPPVHAPGGRGPFSRPRSAV